MANRTAYIVIVGLLTVFLISPRAEAWAVDGAVPAGPACRLPVPYTSLHYGLERQLVDRAFHEYFYAAFRDQGTLGTYFIPVLRALKQDFRFDVDIRAYELEIEESDRVHYGLRNVRPSGLAGLPEQALEVFSRYPEADMNPIVGLYANVFASSCLPEERLENERIATNLIAANAPEGMSFHLLDWIIRMHDAACIGDELYASLAATLGQRTHASLESLDAAEYFLGLFMLIRAGEEAKVSPQNLRPLLEHLPATDEWEDGRSPVFGRRDVLLAGSYVLAHVLAQGDPDAPKKAMIMAVERMQESGFVRGEGPVSDALESLQLQVAMDGLDSCALCEPTGSTMQ